MANALAYDYLFRFVMKGDYGAGKSCFLLRYVDGTFYDGFISTIGVDFKLKTIKSSESNKTLKLQIWDPASGERFRQMPSSYYRGAHGIFFMFDVTDRASFQSLNTHFEEVNKSSHEHLQRILVGTKIDDTEKRVVSYEEAKELADHMGIAYIETSAKNNININEAVNMLARSVEANLDKFNNIGLPPTIQTRKPNEVRRCIIM